MCYFPFSICSYLFMVCLSGKSSLIILCFPSEVFCIYKYYFPFPVIFLYILVKFSALTNMIFSFPLRLYTFTASHYFLLHVFIFCISSSLFCSQPSSGVTGKTCSQCLPNHYGSLSQGCSREYPVHSGRYYETLSFPTSANYKGQSGGQSRSNVLLEVHGTEEGSHHHQGHETTPGYAQNPYESLVGCVFLGSEVVL